MSQPPSEWDPSGGQPQYGQPQYGQPQYGQPQYGQPQYGQPQYGQPAGQPGYTPPPAYGGYPPYQPVGYGYPNGGYSNGNPQQPYGYPPPGPSRPGVVTAAAVLDYVHAAGVLMSTFFVLAAAAAAVEWLLVGIVQLASIGLLVFGGVQLTSGAGRRLHLIANGVQFALVAYYLIRFASLGGSFDFGDGSGLFIFPIVFAVFPAIAVGLSLNGAATQFQNQHAATRLRR